MRTELGNQIHDVLMSRIGRDQAISAPQLCDELGLRRTHERTVRETISTECALWDGFVVCAGSCGYFAAADIEEILAYDNWLAEQVDTLVQKRDRLRACCALMGIRLINEERRAA